MTRVIMNETMLSPVWSTAGVRLIIAALNDTGKYAAFYGLPDINQPPLSELIRDNDWRLAVERAVNAIWMDCGGRR